MSFKQINKERKTLFVRSAYLGDFIVTLPQLKSYLETEQISFKNVNFLLLNKENINSNHILFGKNTLISKNTQVVQNNNLITFLLSFFKARLIIKGVDNIVYMNYTQEKKFRKFIKIFFLKIFWPFTKINGIELKKVYSRSQYTSAISSVSIDKSNLGKLKKWYLEKTENYENIKKITEKIFIKNKSNLHIGIYCDGKMPTKIWPIENYRKLIQGINAKHKATFYLIGAQENHSYNETLRKKLLIDKIIQVINIAGKLSVPETVEFLSRLNCFVTNDGLPMHLAAIANTPTVALFTYREELGAWEPNFTNQFVSVRTNTTCKHCFKIYCENPVCIKETPSEIICKYVLEILSSSKKIRKNIVLQHSNPFLSASTKTFSQ